MNTGFFRKGAVEKKRRAMSIVTSAEPMEVEIIRKFKSGPTSATHTVPGGGAGTEKLGDSEGKDMKADQIQNVIYGRRSPHTI